MPARECSASALGQSPNPRRSGTAHPPRRKVATDPDEFLLTSFDGDVRSGMVQLDALIRDALPGRSRTLWEGRFWGGTDQWIVGYGDIIQPRPKGEPVEWFLVGLARQSRHYSLYVNAVDDGTYLLDRYRDRLGNVKIGSASIAITSLDKVDLDALGELLRRANELFLG